MDSLWHKYKHLSKRKRHALHSLGVGLVFFVLLWIFSKLLSVSVCPIQNIFGISCFGCGLTRGFIAILHLDFKAAISYHVLSIPLFAGIFLYGVFCVTDALFDKDYIERIEKQLSKKYMYGVYLLILILAAVLNRMS